MKAMVQISIDYKGELRCSAQHGPSEAVISTDAPVDNHGKGESFSPTDLVATALGTCMATIMGIVARNEDVSLKGLRISVQKEMSSELPRRIVSLPARIEMPITEGHSAATKLKEGALACPVKMSLHPEIKQEVTWIWKE